MKINQAARLLNDYDIVFEGHTDSFGNDSENFSLSVDRAHAVRDYFIQNGTSVSQGGSRARGFGETKPIATNETEAGRRKNRRIDIVFYPTTTL